VVFVTDFGLGDGYAAELHAAAGSASPGVRCIDGSHLVPPGEVLTAAYLCKRMARAFGPRNVVCVVVDPGVGGERMAVAVECDGVLGVAPDTGLLSYLWMESHQRRAVRVVASPAASPTFHGRDVFAPLAARLAAGMPIAECGEAVPTPTLRGDLIPVLTDDGAATRVVAIDHFGNCVTGLRREDAGGREVAGLRWASGSTTLAVRTYEQIPGDLAVLWNSGGHLELAARGRSAAELAGLHVGEAVEARLA